jgi:hypothetical protein
MAIRSLNMGANGPDVKALQEALNAWGADPSLDTDGSFGSKTDTAVRKFQEANGLKVDGTVGRDTRAALFPIGVATVTIYGMRLKMPDPPTFRGGSPPLTLPPLNLSPPPRQKILSYLTRPLYEPTCFPGLTTWLPAPKVSDWNLPVPSAPGSPPAQPFGFSFDHVELQPGGQSTFPFNGARQNLFVLTMQNVYRRGPDNGAHQEADLGVQMGAPVSNPNGPWTVNPFVQLTDVDRFGSLGAFHYWQPYAQAGFQFMGLGNPQPSLTGNLFPVNLGLDIGDVLTVNLAGGLALTMNLQNGQVLAGPQFTAGITLKLGKPNSPF